MLRHTLLEEPLASPGTDDGLSICFGDGDILCDGLLQPVLPVVKVVAGGVGGCLVVRWQTHASDLLEHGLCLRPDQTRQNLGECLGQLGQIDALETVPSGRKGAYFVGGSGFRMPMWSFGRTWCR